MEVISKAYIEPYLETVKTHQPYQFIRKGYFCIDRDSTEDRLVFNRTVSLKEAWKPKV